MAERAARTGWRHAPISRLALVVCSLGLAAGVMSCGSGGAESTSDAPAVAATFDDPVASGSVSLDLAAGNANFSAVTYTIIGGQFHTSGTLDISHSTRISGTIAGIPFGTNYVLTMNAVSTDAATTCDGSASFDISSQVPVPVPVHLTCKQQTLVAATPAPIPPAAPLVLCLVLFCIGLMQQRRMSPARNEG